MPIPLPDQNRLAPGPIRDFVEALHQLYDRAGQPAGRRISRSIYRTQGLEAVSHETVSAALRGDSVPAWEKVQSIVTALAQLSIRPISEAQVDELMDLFYELWIAVRRPVGESTPAIAAEPAPAVESPPGQSDPPPAPVLWSIPDGTAASRGETARLVGAMPDRNTYFTGRELLLDTMRRRHIADPHAPLVLFGLGGVGKTQIAREYVARYADGYAVVWWIQSDQPEQARASMMRLAQRLGLPVRQSADQTIAGVVERLQSPRNDEFLLVFDGARGDDVRSLIPSIGGNVIVTSRDPRWAHDTASNGLEVPDFDLAEAIQFLRKHDNALVPEQAEGVFARLGRVPFALDQLAAVRRATNRSWSDLLGRLDAHELAVDDAAMTPFRLAVSELRDADPDAALVFELFAWFGPEPVPVPLLRRGASGDVSPRLKWVIGDPIRLRRAVAEINRFGLGRLHTEDQRIEVQPLDRRALRESLSDDERERVRADVQAILVAADQGWPDDLPIWDMHEWMAPHVLAAELLASTRPDAQTAVYHQIRFRYLLGDYEDARTLGENAVSAWTATLGPDHEMVLRATREWANALRSLGRYAEAKELTTAAMTRLRTHPQYGPDHPYTLSMARSHAADLRIDGRYREAFELDQANYEQHVGRYTNEYRERAATSRHNLAVSLRLLGRFAEAEALDRAELAHRRVHLGDDDPKTVLTLNGLAEDLYGLGRYREVLDLWSQGLEIGPRALRRDERGMLLVRRTFGLAHRRLGQSQPAIELLRAHYYECVRSFGAVHEITLAATMSYANALRDRVAERGEAYATASDAVSAYEGAFGGANPLTSAALVNQAVMLRARGDTLSALRADEAAVRALQASVGELHPFTVVAMINLATDRALTGDRHGALGLSEAAYRAALETHGPQHSDTLAAAANLTADRASAGSSATTDPSLDVVLADLRRTLGPEHPVVAAVASGIRVECDIEPPSFT